MLFGVSLELLLGHVLLGLINGSFYAILSLGLAVIFGILNIVNFAHGAFYMLGAMIAWMLLNYFGVSYWWSMLLAPLVVAALAVFIEQTALRHIAGLDPLYGLLLTFGIAQLIEGLLRNEYGSSGMPYTVPSNLAGGIDFGIIFMPIYRIWALLAALAVCCATWFIIERTSLGSRLRAATENAPIVESFGVNVSWLVTLTYAAGAALAAITGVLAAPIYQVSPMMGQNLMIVVFAIVVIGGLGSIAGAILTGISLGVAEGITRAYYPQGSEAVAFVIMVLVLQLRPDGLFRRAL